MGYLRSDFLVSSVMSAKGSPPLARTQSVEVAKVAVAFVFAPRVRGRGLVEYVWQEDEQTVQNLNSKPP